MMLPRIKIGTSGISPVYCYDRYTHVLLTGKSGTGKSSLLASWWQQDEMYRNAKVLVEPSGFLAKECYSISRGKAMYCSVETPVSLNPLQAPYSPSVISELIAECINQIIELCTPNEKFTVKMRSILDEEVKWCLEHNRKSLIHVRDRINIRTGDTETRSGVLSRLDFLLSDELMSPIICGNDTIQWGKFIKDRKTLIVDCFKMGKEKMIFVGNLVTQQIKNYFRFERPEAFYPLSIYLDEAANFLTPSLFDVLREGRKFKLSTILSLIDFNIPEKLLKTLLNVGTIVSYRVGAREASYLAREMHCATEELQFLPKYHVAYLTSQGRGIAKAPRPPLVKKIEPKKVELKPPLRIRWFELQPYQPA